MTTKGKLYPSRTPVYFEGIDGLIILDQIRTVDKTRLVEKLGAIDSKEQKAVLSTLVEMFSEDRQLSRDKSNHLFRGKYLDITKPD